MTDKQEYDVFIAKLGDKVREIREDYLNLSDINQRRFELLCQTIFEANGIVVASEIVKGMLKSDY